METYKFEELTESVKNKIRSRYNEFCIKEGLGGFESIEEIDEMLEDLDNDYTEEGETL